MKSRAGYFLAAFLAVQLGPALADQKQRVLTIMGNFSHENLICGAYSLFVMQCLKNRDQNDPLVEHYLKLSDQYFKRGIETGKVARISDKAISAKVDMAIEQMKDDAEGNCGNISVILQKHGRSCKVLFDDGPTKLEKDISGVVK